MRTDVRSEQRRTRRAAAAPRPMTGQKHGASRKLSGHIGGVRGLSPQLGEARGPRRTTVQASSARGPVQDHGYRRADIGGNSSISLRPKRLPWHRGTCGIWMGGGGLQALEDFACGHRAERINHYRRRKSELTKGYETGSRNSPRAVPAAKIPNSGPEGSQTEALDFGSPPLRRRKERGREGGPRTSPDLRSRAEEVRRAWAPASRPSWTRAERGTRRRTKFRFSSVRRYRSGMPMPAFAAATLSADKVRPARRSRMRSRARAAPGRSRRNPVQP